MKLERLLLLIRCANLILVLILLAQPVVTRPDEGLTKPWAILLDTSKSMRVNDALGRFDVAKKILPSILKKFPSAKLFTFSEGIGEMAPADLASALPNGNQSDIGRAIKEVMDTGRYKGIILLSDGRQVGRTDPVTAAASAGKPVLAVAFGNKGMLKDASIRAVHAPPFAFKNIPTSMSVDVAAYGLSGRELTVRLKENDRLLGFQTVKVGLDEAETAVNFTWTPGSVGTKSYSISIDPVPNEVAALNNNQDLTIDVGRDRFRVLYICGKPGYEYGFLRHQFKADPAVELVTFVILRNSGNVLSVPDSELSLIPFPTQDELIQQMPTFDLIVFEEFSFMNYGLMPGIMHVIKRKVEEGGSFLLMGGPESFGQSNDYERCGVMDMFPLEFGQDNIKTMNEPFHMRAVSLTHPVMRLDDNPDINKEIWASLPSLEGVTPLARIRPGAMVLGDVSIGDKSYPVLTVWKYRKGRVGLLTTRTTWRWSLMSGDKRTAGAYQRFWKNMVLWLTHADENKQVRLALENKRVRLGDPAVLRMWTYDEYFKPLTDTDIKLQLKMPDGKTDSVDVQRETAGVFRSSLKPEMPGTYAADGFAFRKGKELGRDHISFKVAEGTQEEEGLTPNDDLMNELARSTDGRFIPADQFSLNALEEFAQSTEHTRSRKILLWNHPFLLIAILLLYGVDLTLRKRRGLP